MSAEAARIASNGSISEIVADGSDCYIFILRGAAKLECRGSSRAMPSHSTAVVQEGQAWTLSAVDGDCDAIIVHAPPPGSGLKLPGFVGGFLVTERSSIPALDVPEQKKKRYYIVGKEAAPTSRGHAMIVDYVAETFTPMHHHPNADSMFVLLEGAIRFSSDSEQVVVAPGSAAVFAAGDKHSVRCPEGVNHASFLEFHIPAGFTTVKES
jgi:quercetin dioxygenase-like cupin family protein